MQPRSLEDPAGRENVNLQTWTVWTWLQWGACIRWHIRMGSESQLVLQINKLKYQKSCIFKKLPKSAKRCKKCQNRMKSAKSFQIVQKSAKKCQKGLFYLCLLFFSQSLKHHHSQTVKAKELKFLEDVHCSSPTTCYMSHVICHLSLVRCQVVVCLYQTVKARDLTFWEYDHFPPSVTCHMSYVTVTVTTVNFITVTATHHHRPCNSQCSADFSVYLWAAAGDWGIGLHATTETTACGKPKVRPKKRLVCPKCHSISTTNFHAEYKCVEIITCWTTLRFTMEVACLGDSVPKLACAAVQAPSRSHLTHSGDYDLPQLGENSGAGT